MSRSINLWVAQRVIGPLIRRAGPSLFVAARLWRRLLTRTTFVAVTGSVGKTTAKEALALILSAHGPTFKSVGNQNAGALIAVGLLRVRPWHRFAVFEVGVDAPGHMDRLAGLVSPDVGLIVGLARVHSRQFPDPADYVAEKLKFVHHVRPEGLLIVNGDDPRLREEAARAHGGALLFGSDPGCEIWADDVSSRWPERLQFRVHCSGETHLVRTQLLGVHWVPSLLAALAAAKHLGMALGEAAAALAGLPPHTARLEPVELPNGSVIIRDEYGGHLVALHASLAVLEQARARRRILVLTGVTSSDMADEALWRHVGQRVTGWLDELVLVASEAARLRRTVIDAGMAPDRVHSFDTLAAAATFVRADLQSGDLLLLRGRTKDHATRLFYALLGSVACSRTTCPKTMLCDSCWELGFRPDGAVVPASLGRRV